MLLLIIGVLFLIIIALVIAVAVYVYKTQRQFVNLDEICKNAMSQIDVQLNTRYDMLIALAKKLKQFNEAEANSMIKTIEARRPTGAVKTAAEAQQQQDFLGQMMSHLSVVVEKYPEFHFEKVALQDREDTKEYEENVRMARMVYNDTATKLNRMIRQWPSAFVASMLGFKERDYLTVDRAEKRDMPFEQL